MKPPEPQQIALASINFDGSPQARDVLNEGVAAEYSSAMDAGELFDPVELFDPGDDAAAYLLADGRHRCEGARLSGRTIILANVQSGDYRAAARFAAGSNKCHGLRRTRADKRAAVLLLLDDDEFATNSDRWVADVAGVSHTFVAKLRAEKVATMPPEAKAESGKPKAAPEVPSAEPEPPAQVDPDVPADNAAELETLADCPNCGGSEFDEDGDCANCRHPCAAVPPEPAEPWAAADDTPVDVRPETAPIRDPDVPAEKPKPEPDKPTEPNHIGVMQAAVRAAVAPCLPEYSVVAADFLRDLAAELTGE